MYWIPVPVLLLCVSIQPAVSVTDVRMLWDQAPHSAFTDLIRFQDRWYCTFREGAGHAQGAGTIRVLVSPDGQAWMSAANLDQTDVDLRDPKLSTTPDGRLMMVGGAAVPASRDPVKDHYSFVCFSDDGSKWTKPQRVLGSWQWLWRVTWHKGTAYGVAYAWDPKAPGKTEKYTAALYKSRDGIDYEKVCDFNVPNATEATLRFDGDKMHCLQRRDGSPNSAFLGVSSPPYKHWEWKDLGSYFGGPNFVRRPDGVWLACGRIMAEGTPHTALAQLDVKKGMLKELVRLPSGGDTSYPGMIWHRDQLWVSYYSSHEKKSNIYLARLEIR